MIINYDYDDIGKSVCINNIYLSGACLFSFSVSHQENWNVPLENKHFVFYNDSREMSVVWCEFHVYYGKHDDVIKWKHFLRHWPFVRRIHQWPVNSPHKGQWRRALMFSLICAWINNWVNIPEAGDLGRHRAHYDVTVMGNVYLSTSVPKAGITKSRYQRQGQVITSHTICGMALFVPVPDTCFYSTSPHMRLLISKFEDHYEIEKYIYSLYITWDYR